MFQLVVAVISIALFAMLSLTALFYGGSTFQEASERSIYVRYGNEAIQIREAMRLFSVEKIVKMDKFHDVSFAERDDVYNFEALVDGEYLKDLSLRNNGWIIDKGVVRKPLEVTPGSMSESNQLQRCKNFNAFSRKNLNAAGIENGCPLCADARYADYPACWVEGEEG